MNCRAFLTHLRFARLIAFGDGTRASANVNGIIPARSPRPPPALPKANKIWYDAFEVTAASIHSLEKKVK